MIKTIQKRIKEISEYLTLYLINEKLEAENKRLKEANQSLSMLGTDLASANETVRKEFFRADKNKDMWREKAEKLQQTLQEIKSIAERKITYIDFTKSKNCVELEQDYARINYELEQKIFEILQKIAKARVE